MKTIEILEKLIGFPTQSLTPNMALIDYVKGLLEAKDVDCMIVAEETGQRANLYATIYGKGNVEKSNRGGVLLSGHSDVVPVEGQDWSQDPFQLTKRDGCLFGRGTADMKGFLASAIRTALLAAEMDLQIPLHLAISFDEEIGCVGVRHLIERLRDAPIKPHFCIIGEPTSLEVATGHKGKTALRATCIGEEGHSAMAPNFLNAIHLGADFVQALRNVQNTLMENGAKDDDYDIPYSTVHVGKMSGGIALNIVPNKCVIDFEIRSLAQDDPNEIIEMIQSQCTKLVNAAKKTFARAAIQIEIVNSYPGLDTNPGDDIVTFVKSLSQNNHSFKIPFGTEGGLFDQQLSIPTVVCGPGSMDQGHKPDEYISIDQLTQCDAMMDNLLKRLKAGF